ncbi:MAG: T9SS type A sorting domain-containing protein [Bacteroidetes bacterium]|nr:T9SS type A sorting domain-containing protein [Bacteroidota bacterium]
MALTYEDMNCTAAGEFDRTARALLGSAADFLGLTGITSVAGPAAMPDIAMVTDVYPHPVPTGGAAHIRISGTPAGTALREVRASIHDLLGREVALLYEGMVSEAGQVLQLSPAGLAAGTYLLRVASGTRVETRPLLLLP